MASGFCAPGDNALRGGEGDDDDEEDEDVGEGMDDDSEMVDELEAEELKSGGEGVVLGDKAKPFAALLDTAGLTAVTGGALMESHRSSSCFKLSLALSLRM